MPPTNASGTAALAAILERAQTALQAVVQASATLSADLSSQAPWSELTALAAASMRELAAAHAGIAAAEALRPTEAPTPPPAPDRPPPDESSRTAALAAWDDRRCIVVDPPDDKMRRAATDIAGMGAALTDSLRPLLKAPHGRVVDQLRRTAKGGYCAQICAPFSDQARALTALKIGDQGTWSSTPLRQTRRPSNGGPTNSRPPEIRRDSFVLSPVPDSMDTSELLATFSRDNAARLGLSPTALAARLTRAERLQRRLSRGSQAGQWVPSRSVRITGEPALVASIIAATHAVLGFHSVEVRQFSLPALHCFHCGAAGHVARHCRGRCHQCDRRHPTQPCPRRPAAPDRRDRREEASERGARSPRGTASHQVPEPRPAHPADRGPLIMSQHDSFLGGDQAQTPPSAVPGLRVLQVNLRYSHFGFTMLQQFLQSNPIDVILIQDPPQVILSGQGFLAGYNFILSDNFDPTDHSCRPLSAIVLRSSLRFQRLPPVHRRLSGALISTRRGQLAVISAYIRHGDGEGIF